MELGARAGRAANRILLRPALTRRPRQPPDCESAARLRRRRTGITRHLLRASLHRVRIDLEPGARSVLRRVARAASDVRRRGGTRRGDDRPRVAMEPPQTRPPSRRAVAIRYGGNPACGTAPLNLRVGSGGSWGALGSGLVQGVQGSRSRFWFGTLFPWPSTVARLCPIVRRRIVRWFRVLEVANEITDSLRSTLGETLQWKNLLASEIAAIASVSQRIVGFFQFTVRDAQVMNELAW